MVKCIVDNFPFSREHFFNSIKKMDNIFYEGNIKEGTTHILFIDLPENALNMISELKYYKSLGIEIVYSFYDPYRFDCIYELINMNLVDKLILFDKQYINKFNVKTYISDYFVNEDLFPINKIYPLYDKKCYFGNLIERKLDDNTDHLVILEFKDLYKKVQEYKKLVVFDIGRLSDGTIIHHNKVKYIEALMCGVSAECQEFIKTLNYDKFIDSIDIDINVIRDINKRVIKEFIDIFKNNNNN